MVGNRAEEGWAGGGAEEGRGQGRAEEGAGRGGTTLKSFCLACTQSWAGSLALQIQLTSKVNKKAGLTIHS